MWFLGGGGKRTDGNYHGSTRHGSQFVTSQAMLRAGAVRTEVIVEGLG